MTPITDADELIRGLAPGGKPFDYRPPFELDESIWFVRAVEQGVVSFSECDPGCFRLKKWATSGPDHFLTPDGKPRHLFSAPHAPQAWLNREYVPHIAAYARAILDHGYRQDRSSFSRYRSYGRDLITKRAGGGYETDAEFYDGDGLIHLQVEAKAKAQQVAVLTREIDRVNELSELPVRLVKEIEYVLDLSPRYLWIVGPGSIDPASHVYRVTVDDLTARFEPVDGIPAAPAAPGSEQER